jgi:DNA-binding GntR family transcriptional regulator
MIRKRIIDGEYEPGERLVIPKLARDLEISALPVREALRRLEAEGFVQFDANVGARVTRVDFEAWESAMHVLSLLEGYATALAAPHLTPDNIAELREINRSMGAALEVSDIGAAKDANRRFHVRLYDACPNDHLMGLVRVGWDRLDSLRGWDIYYLLLRGTHLVDEHEHLLTMIESGAPASEIEAYAREHKLRTVEVYRQNQGLLPTVPGARSL